MEMGNRNLPPKLGDYADRKQVDIAAGTGTVPPEPPEQRARQMVRFVDECAHPRVKANIDISHLVLSDTSVRRR